jgi:hypothetical protein
MLWTRCLGLVQSSTYVFSFALSLSYMYEFDVKYRIQIIQLKKSRRVLMHGRTSTAQHSGIFSHQLSSIYSPIILILGRNAVGAKPFSLPLKY